MLSIGRPRVVAAATPIKPVGPSPDAFEQKCTREQFTRTTDQRRTGSGPFTACRDTRSCFCHESTTYGTLKYDPPEDSRDSGSLRDNFFSYHEALGLRTLRLGMDGSKWKERIVCFRWEMGFFGWNKWVSGRWLYFLVIFIVFVEDTAFCVI